MTQTFTPNYTQLNEKADLAPCDFVLSSATKFKLKARSGGDPTLRRREA